MAANPEALLPPGFRFHPTDEELILHYLRNQATSLPCPVSIIAEVDIYKFDPWDLPAKASFGDREWYFFSPRDRKYPNGVRPNRAAASGYWKATGTDKPIVAAGLRKENIGVKKALVFYKGKPPKGLKTNWIMHEYRLADATGPATISSFDRPKRPRDSSMRLDDWVLCRIYKKNNSQPSSSSDRDYEDSSSEDAFFLPGAAGSAPAPQSGGKLPKSASLTDLFNDADFSVLTRLLHENPSDMAEPEHELGPFLGQPASLTQPFVGVGDNGAAAFSFLPKLAPMEPPAPAARGCFKRQRAAATTDYGGAGGEAAAPPQCNFLNQPYLQQRIMLNSRFGLP